MLNGLDLFSGIGGLSVALEPWVRPIAYCENDRYAQSVLLSRMAGGDLPMAPIWDDVRTLRASMFSETPIDILYGGFPCQDISVAGAGASLAGERSGLFWEIDRLCREFKKGFQQKSIPYIFLENVPAITTRGGVDVVGAFTQMGYDCRWCVIGAYEVGANHKRDRWFLLAHAHSKRLERLELYKRSWESQPKIEPVSLPSVWETSNCPTLRVDDELPRPMDRIKCLGNAVVPLQARTAFEILMGLTQTT